MGISRKGFRLGMAKLMQHRGYSKSRAYASMKRFANYKASKKTVRARTRAHRARTAYTTPINW